MSETTTTPRGATHTPALAWHALASAEALARLGTSEAGLVPQEAADRLARCGPNLLARDEGPGPIRILLRQLHEPIVYLLLASSALAMALGKPVDGAVVLGAVVVNALIGFVQEYRAGRAIAALSRMVPDVATVVRGGRRLSVPAAELVPGDVVVLASGDRVPADARVLSARQLHADEAALTGESLPVAKHVEPANADAPLGDRRSLLYGGTHVTSGSGMAVVVATGGATELGRISALLGQVIELQTPLTRALGRVGRWLTVGVVALGLALLAVGLLRGYSLADGLLVAVTIAVAAIPEGLPAIITIALAIGVQRMARRRAVVRHLPSVETLGSTTVICTDKTGTLTRNEMTVQQVWTPVAQYDVSGVGYAPEGVVSRAGVEVGQPPEELAAALRAAALCNDASLHAKEGAWAVAGDPTEGALVVAAEKAGLAVDDLRRDWPRLDAIPFESERQYMATLHALPSARAVQRAPAGASIFVKGAPEVVLARCALPEGADAVLGEVHALARQGMRVLALAHRRADGATALHEEDVRDLTFLGLAGMIDPPRPEAVAAIAACHGAGVAVKMITGDHRGTAEAIGARLGLLGPGQRALTGAELGALDGAALRRAAHEVNVFARVAPEHKLRLVRALQEEGHVVAMTGDGVNDAPALKQADIGVAMGITGTAVAKEASDVVLADDHFATISAAVEEGRRTYDNLVKALAFVLPTNLGLGAILVVAVLFFPLHEVGGALEPLLPILPTQLLWVNLVASVALALPLAFEVKERDVMRRPPRDPGAPVLGAFVVARTVLVAFLMAGAAVGLFLWEYRREAPLVGHAVALAEARTMAVTTVVFFQAFYLLNCRSLRESAFRIGFFSNRMVFVGIAALAALQVAFIYLPPLQSVFGTAALVPRDVALAALAGAVVLPVVSVEKLLRARAAARVSRPPARPRPDLARAAP
ncbi:HAD-IC family P-type ATPase [Anaeromyxobacter sp. Fw109-5]|uniref:cation-translocating P-type ATPase n=1 Tax=Anaeromyxobacter sp. (strain Fw109-5) TaxID=404589 RepID=UPI0000ED6DD8|nr:HAD-IC family P-type ATPase [Anaeromyxobacter sp. Fw109-5]ABS28042.1 ATPase, P-type (transporting), HAD superfamily, subfamily IC [Anaeromyxobacter sp. Fw109-5]